MHSLVLILFALFSFRTRADYVQPFNILAAIPINLSSHSQAGFSSSNWFAKLVLISTDDGVTLAVNCDNNSNFVFREKRYLRVSTSFSNHYDEQKLQEFLIEMKDESACTDLIGKIVENPKAFRIKIENGATATVETIPGQ